MVVRIALLSHDGLVADNRLVGDEGLPGNGRSGHDAGHGALGKHWLRRSRTSAALGCRHPLRAGTLMASRPAKSEPTGYGDQQTRSEGIADLKAQLAQR